MKATIAAKKITTFRLSEELLERLKVLAKRENRSLNNFVEKGFMECHIENDFLIIWFDEDADIIKLVRLGLHTVYTLIKYTVNNRIENELFILLLFNYLLYLQYEQAIERNREYSHYNFSNRVAISQSKMGRQEGCLA